MEKSKDTKPEPALTSRGSRSVIPSENRTFYPSRLSSIVLIFILPLLVLYLLYQPGPLYWPAIIFTKQEAPPIPGPISANITLPLDHFNTSETRRFINRYWMNDTYYHAGGPIFLYDAGEAGISDAGAAQTLNNPKMKFAPIELAKKYHGIAIMWEHRFYGGSMPFEVSNLTGIALNGSEAYRYLTNEQALEDVVYLAKNFDPPGYSVEWTEKMRAHRSPWVWIGGSYPGVRAAMTRVRNPNVFFANWASSAPVQTQVDNSVYFNSIYQTMPKNCSADVHAAVTYADSVLISGTEEEVKLVKRAIWLANSANPRNISFAETPEELSLWNISQILSYPFQASSFHFQSFGYERSLGTFCNQLETWNPSNSTPFSMTSNISVLETNDLSRIPTPTGLAASSPTDGDKHAFYAYLYATIQKSLSDFSASPNSRRKRADIASWTWQLCTQFAQFQVSQHPSPHNLISRFYNITNHLDWYCHGMFPYAPKQPGVKDILRYGGWKMRPSNVMFTNGKLDPWRALGTQSDTSINPDALNRRSTLKVPKCNVPPDGDDVFGAIWEGAAHVRDLRTANESFDGSPVQKGLELFEQALDEWLPCFYAEKVGKDDWGEERFHKLTT
jgi:hypothetical protein